MERPKAQPTVQMENELARVTEWRFSPGAETGWHRHEYDYLVVPITSGGLLIDDGSARNTATLVCGQSYFRRAGVEHNVINDNDFEFIFVETEFKPTG